MCNKDNLFVDSALVITDAEYTTGWTPTWKHSFNHGQGRYKAWSELNKCALSKAQNATGRYQGTPVQCEKYLESGQPEAVLTNVKNRQYCPMIPDFGKSQISDQLPRLIAQEFFETLE